MLKKKKKKKETTKCDKSTIKCDVSTTQCEDGTVKYEKKKKPSNATKELPHVMLKPHNVRMEQSNVMFW